MRTLLLASLVLTACGDDGGGTTVDAPVGPFPDAGPTLDIRGEIEVIEAITPYEPYGTVRARFYTERAPRWHQVVAAEGDCQLLAFEQAACDPPCASGFCVAPDVCEPWPDLTPAGTLTIGGLSVPVEIMPDEFGNYYPDALPADLFAPGDPISAQLTGSPDFPSLSLLTYGVAPVRERFPDDQITLVNGQDFTVTWTPTGDGRVKLTLNANNQGHGAPFLSIIECDVLDDDGEITVPAALIDQFDETFRWEICAGADCPLSTLRRYTADGVPLDGRVSRLVVASELQFWVIHDAP